MSCGHGLRPPHGLPPHRGVRLPRRLLPPHGLPPPHGLQRCGPPIGCPWFAATQWAAVIHRSAASPWAAVNAWAVFIPWVAAIPCIFSELDRRSTPCRGLLRARARTSSLGPKVASSSCEGRAPVEHRAPTLSLKIAQVPRQFALQAPGPAKRRGPRRSRWPPSQQWRGPSHFET